VNVCFRPKADIRGDGLLSQFQLGNVGIVSASSFPGIALMPLTTRMAITIAKTTMNARHPVRPEIFGKDAPHHELSTRN